MRKSLLTATVEDRQSKPPGGLMTACETQRAIKSEVLANVSHTFEQYWNLQFPNYTSMHTHHAFSRGDTLDCMGDQPSTHTLATEWSPTFISYAEWCLPFSFKNNYGPPGKRGDDLDVAYASPNSQFTSLVKSKLFFSQRLRGLELEKGIKIK